MRTRSASHVFTQAVIVVVLTMALPIACNDESSTSPTPTETATSNPSADNITLSSVSPTAGTNLSPGQAVTFRGSVFYTLATASSGRITMVIQDQDGRGLQDVSATNLQPSVTISRGTGTASVTDLIRIPSQGVNSVHVFLALTPAGATSTNTVVRIDYPVQ